MNQTVQELDRELAEWVENLPDNVRNAKNDRENTKMLVLCLTAFFVYYSAIINLRACTPPPSFRVISGCGPFADGPGDPQTVRLYLTLTHQSTICHPLSSA